MEETAVRENQQEEVIRVRPKDLARESALLADYLQRLPSLVARGLVYLVILFVLSAAVYSLLAKVDIVVASRAVARPTSHLIRILSDRSGYVEKIFVTEGQSVERNAPLFLIRSRMGLTHLSKVEELRRTIPLKREFYETKILSTRDELNRSESDHLKSTIVKRIKLDQNRLSLDGIESDLHFWRTQKHLYSEEYEKIKVLYQRGVISVREYNQTKIGLDKASTEEEKLLSKKEITLKEHDIIRQEMEKETANHLGRRSILEKEVRNLELEMEATLTALTQELEMNEKMLTLQDRDSATRGDTDEREKIIRAENAGTVSELHLRNTGHLVKEYDILCTILPADRPLYMDITVANKDIGFIEKGNRIKYKFDAFPYVDYGILNGEVTAISPSAVEDEKLGMVYHVQGSLPELHYSIQGKTYPIKAGMTATAEMVTEHRSIFSILFKELKGKIS